MSDAIKQTLRNAQTVAEIKAASDESRKAVQDMYAQGGTARTLAQQIINLKAQRLEQTQDRILGHD